jgi:hypothetical protein
MTDQISEFTRRAFSAHPGLSARVVALLKWHLEDQLQEILKQGDIATARKLAWLATRDEVAGVVYELNRRNTRGRYPLIDDYLRPTVDALLWRDTRLRSVLAADPQQACLLPAYKCAARHESSWRACIFIKLLSELAKMTTQFPDERAVAKVASWAREAADEWRASEALYALGLPNQAEQHKRRAFMILWYARILARECAREYRDKLLRVAFWRLAQHFGFKANRIAGALVSAALELKKAIPHPHTRYIGKSFYVAKK